MAPDSLSQKYEACGGGQAADYPSAGTRRSSLRKKSTTTKSLRLRVSFVMPHRGVEEGEGSR